MLVVGWSLVGSPVLVFVAPGVGVGPRQSWRLQLQVLQRLLLKVGVS